MRQVDAVRVSTLDISSTVVSEWVSVLFGAFVPSMKHQNQNTKNHKDLLLQKDFTLD